MEFYSKLFAFRLFVIFPLLAGASAPRTAKLLKGRIEYQPPEGWELSIGSSNDRTATWGQTDGPGILAIQVMPDDAVITQRTAKAMVKQLHDAHVKAKDQVILEPTLETDSRFAIRIRERFKHGADFSDQLHLYKMVGARPCMLTVNAMTDDQDAAKAVHQAGEQTLLSAKFIKK